MTEITTSELEKKLLENELKKVAEQVEAAAKIMRGITAKYCGQSCSSDESAKLLNSMLYVEYNKSWTKNFVVQNVENMSDELKKTILNVAIDDFMSKVAAVGEILDLGEQQ